MDISTNVTIRKNTINDNLVEYFGLDDFIVNYENNEEYIQHPKQKSDIISNAKINADKSQKYNTNSNKPSQLSIIDKISKHENANDILDEKGNNILLTTITNYQYFYNKNFPYSLDDLLTYYDDNAEINETQKNSYLISEKNVFTSNANTNINGSTKINSKAKGLYYISPTDFYKKCIKVHYSPFITQGNNPRTTYVERTAQILKSGSLGGTVQFFPNGNQYGEREGQPGGIVPPLRNRF